MTVKTRPGDNLMIHKALQLAKPGDVIVVDGGGDLTNALIGEIMIGDAIQRGLGDMVIYGAVRDSAWIAERDFPVFAAGVTHRGPYKDGPGEINVPIAVEGAADVIAVVVETVSNCEAIVSCVRGASLRVRRKMSAELIASKF